MLFGGWEHCERQEQQGEQDQGVCWHEDVSLQLEFSLTRMWYAVVMVVDMRDFFITSTCLTLFSTYELVVDKTVDSKDNLEEKTREVTDIRMYHITSVEISFI